MTRYTLLLSLCLMACISACRKKADCSGTVFSKHHIPMPNVTVQVGYSEGGKSQTVGYYSLKTNNEGHFSMDEKIAKKRNLEDISVSAGDSGHFQSGSRPTKDMEIVLQ